MTILIFSLLAALLTIFVLVLVLRPVFTRSTPETDSSEALAVDIYQNRLQEIQQELDNALIDKNSEEAINEQLSQELLHSTTGESISLDYRPVNRWGVFTLAVCLTVTSAILYYQWGRPELLLQPDVQDMDAQPAPHEQLASINAMVDGLAQRLQQNPDDLEGWLMLSRSYMVLQRYQEAVAATERLLELAGPQTYLLMQYAEIRIMANNGNINADIRQILDQALLSIQHTGRMLPQSEKEKGSEYAMLIEYWQNLLPLLQSDPEFSGKIRTLIDNFNHPPQSTPSMGPEAELTPESG